MKLSRRTFLVASVGAASALAFAREALAAPPVVQESDPAAQALGYRSDATHVDKTQYPRYAAGQMCGNCAYYQGQPTDAFAPCPMLGGRRVSGKGWCGAYIRKS
ncbi:High potential iron-sulfur protein [Burkholderia sp. WAC0059]|uniref:high-potential iron-sulfur protein n=1 Tax=Burkholderia sp. WAC0059 TaxID=2066022 RepID=UPI000C7EF42A|nr:high-potential iron-sulfur protein [Burkholderia sp. WAC0059]PLZ02295.1 High potential iron-sulfur protein [Burkholderia sp. WAC0059]